MQVKNRGIQWWVKILGVVLPAIFVVITIILNTNYREPLFLMGVNEVYDMQSHSSPALNFIENIFSMIGNPITVIAILALQYLCTKRKLLCFINLLYVMGGFYFMAVLKQIYQETRPFWISSEVKIIEWFCPTDFGNPSGHSFIVIALYEPLFSDFLGTGKKKFGLIIWTFVSAMVLVSRMYLGAHSLDQIILGCLLGFSFVVMYRFRLQQFFFELFTNLLNQKLKLFCFIGTLATSIAFLIVPIVTYQLNVANRQINTQDIVNLNAACDKSVTSDSLKEGILKATIGGFLSLGIIFGGILLKNKEKKDTYYMLGMWSFKDTASIIKFHVALAVVVGIPSVILIILIPRLIGQAIIRYIFMSLGATYAGIGLVYILPLLQNKYQWITYDRNSEVE